MQLYDTLILGAGYSSVGFAMARKNCVICEENQICDTHFYLPLKSFRYHPYTPQTAEGKRLRDIFSELSLFGTDMQNTNGFECGFCRYLTESATPPEVLLKCRAVKTERRDDRLYDVTVQTNEGLLHLFAKHLLDTRGNTDQKFFTILFVTEDIGKTAEVLRAAFPGSDWEKAFYPGRYALHIPADGWDENGIKSEVYRRWCALMPPARILYMAPTFAQECAGGELCDDLYRNPVEAFEAGYFWAKEEDK